MNKSGEDDEEKLPMYGREDIAAMLHADSFCRKQRDWPLVSSTEILNLNRQLMKNAADYSCLLNQNELLSINSVKNINPLRRPHEPFRQQFPFIDVIFKAFPGKLIAAGGSIYRAFQESGYCDDDSQQYHHDLIGYCDVDLFFIDCTEKEVEEIIRFAVNLVKSPRQHLKYFDDEWQEEIEHGLYDEIGVCVDRCQNTTTIYYTTDADVGEGDEEYWNYIAEYEWDNNGSKLQFIHRIYPSAASVVGGFDLGVCMGFYDGDDFYATPFGAWSIATQTIILDVSRRSTSFEYRIVKYITRCFCRLVIVNSSSAEAYRRLGNDPELKLKWCRPFYPVKGLKVITWHLPAAEKYAGLDEKISSLKEKRDLSEDSNDEEKEDLSEEDPFFLRNIDDYKVERLLREKDQATRHLERNLNRFECRRTTRDRISDYDGGGFHEFSVEESNGIFAAQGKVDSITWRSGNLKGVFEKPNIRHKLHPAFDGEFEDPDHPVMYLDAMRRWFTAEQIEALKAGPIEPPQKLPIHREVFEQYAIELRERVEKTIALAKEKADRGITIITENPGRQWTSSYNPIVSDVRDYYNPLLLKEKGPLLIGIPHEIYALLRLAQLKSDSVWRWLPRDVLKLILTALSRALAEDGNRLLLNR